MTIEDTHCRPFTQADVAACLSVFDSNVPAFFSQPERAEFEHFLRDLPGPYLVIERAGDVVGCGGYAVREDAGVADLCWGMVRGDLHRCGLGTLLLEQRIEAALRDPRVRILALSTSQHTVAFYERFGFALRSMQPDGFGAGLDRCDMTREV